MGLIRDLEGQVMKEPANRSTLKEAIALRRVKRKSRGKGKVPQ